MSTIDIKTAASRASRRVAGSRVIIGNRIFPAKLDPGIYVVTTLVHVDCASSKFPLSHTLNDTRSLLLNTDK